MGLIRDLVVGVLRGKARRGAMTSKRGNNRFYKGRGASSTGVHTSKGYYIMKSKIPQIIMPDLEGFKLQPYISYKNNSVKTLPTTKDMFINWFRRPFGQALDAQKSMQRYLKRVEEREAAATEPK